MGTSYCFISNYMIRKWFILFALLFIGNLSFGQTFLFKYNTGITVKADYTQSINANYITLSNGSTPSWIALNISSSPTSSYLQGPNEGKVLVFNPQGTLYLNLPYSTLGMTYGINLLPSPTGSFVVKGCQWINNSQTYKSSFYKYNSTSKTWSLSTSLPTINSSGVSYTFGQSGTQANCAVWCNAINEGGNIVAYVYSY